MLQQQQGSELLEAPPGRLGGLGLILKAGEGGRGVRKK